MNPAEVLSELRGRGVVLALDGDWLRWRAPKGTMTPDLLARIREHKPILLAALRAGTSPALESRMVEWLNRNPPAATASDRCAWCGEDEEIGTVIVPFLAGNHGHVWLHSECWHAWGRNRRDKALAALKAVGLTGP